MRFIIATVSLLVGTITAERLFAKDADLKVINDKKRTHGDTIDQCHHKCDGKFKQHCRLNEGVDAPDGKHVVHKYSCVCERGYVMKSPTEHVCVVHKCFKKCNGFAQKCIENDSTAHLPGGYQCQCDTGYEWKNGKANTHCVKAKVCQGKCTGNSMICVPDKTESAGFHCECNSGYVMDGDKNNCHQHAKCKGLCDRGNMVCVLETKQGILDKDVTDSDVLGAHCKCWTGFKWKDDTHYTCIGDPCFHKCTGPKHVDEVCIEDHTRKEKYRCQCAIGFHWIDSVDNGRNCLPDPCYKQCTGEGQKCDYVKGDNNKHVCGCKAGYVKDGKHQCKKVPTEPAPVDGGWSEFSGWSKCDSKCGAGNTHRARTCTKPAPAHGGKTCVGAAKDSKSCDSGACKPKCTDDEFEMDGKCYNKRVCKKIIDIVETNRCKKKTIADTIV